MVAPIMPTWLLTLSGVLVIATIALATLAAIALVKYIRKA